MMMRFYGKEIILGGCLAPLYVDEIASENPVDMLFNCRCHVIDVETGNRYEAEVAFTTEEPVQIEDALDAARTWENVNTKEIPVHLIAKGRTGWSEIS